MNTDPSIFSKEYRARKNEKVTPQPKKKKPIRQVSKKLAAEKKTYTNMRKEFLGRFENMFCAVFPHLPSCEIHHSRGRGKYLNDTSTWIPVSREGHIFIEENPKIARERGFTGSRLHMTDKLNENL